MLSPINTLKKIVMATTYEQKFYMYLIFPKNKGMELIRPF